MYTFLFCYNSKVILLFCYNSYIIFFVISPGEGSRGPADVPALSVSTRTADRRPGVLQGLLVISSRVKSHKGWTLKEIWALDQSMSDINLFILFISFFLHGTIYFAAYFVYLVFVFWLYHCNKIISICWIRPSVIIPSFDLLHVVSFVVWVFIYLLISTGFNCFDFIMFVSIMFVDFENHLTEDFLFLYYIIW